MIGGAFIGEPTTGHEKPQDSLTEELIFGLLPQRGLVVLVGEPGAGKSLMALRVAACLSTGGQLVDNSTIHDTCFNIGFPAHLKSTLYLAGERYDYLHKRIEAYCIDVLNGGSSSQPVLYENSLPIISLPVRNLSDNWPGIQGRVESQMQAMNDAGFPLGLIVVDTLSASYFISDENSNSEMQRIVGFLRTLGEKFNSLVLVITHPPKGARAKRGNTRGASVLEASADVVWHLEKIGNSPKRKMTITKRSDGVNEDSVFYFEVTGVGDSAVILPISHEEAKKRHDSKRKETRISPNNLTVLQAVQFAARERPCSDLYASMGHPAVQKGSVYSALKTILEKRKEYLKDNAIRQRVDRGLRALIELGLIQKDVDDHGNDIFLPIRPWDQMAAYIQGKYPDAIYKPV